MVSKILDVYMNGYKVGEFTRTTNGAHEFRYISEWLKLNGSRPISMSLPLRSKAYKGAEVFNFFDNLLPDNQKIRERIQARYKSISVQPFDLLESIGKDCVGAIQIIPHAHEMYDIQKIEYEELNNSKLEEILTSYKMDIPLGMIAEDFRISIAGAQEKTALLKYNDQWCLPKNFTPTTHIFKLPIGYVSEEIDMRTSVENEYICLLIAREYGLSVPECEIIEMDSIKALVVERFDRLLSKDQRWIMRLPQEDYCQVLSFPPGRKYESDGGPGIKQIMDHLLGSDNAEVDRENFMKVQVLFWLLAAPDGHAKNFSLFIKPNGNYNLTPFYDILSAYPVVGKQGLNYRKIKLAMALNGTTGEGGKRDTISKIYPRHFIATANHIGFDPDKMIDILKMFKETTPSVIEAVERKLPKSFDEHVANSILTGLLDCTKKIDVAVHKQIIKEKMLKNEQQPQIEIQSEELKKNLERLYLDINLMQRLVRSVYECLVELDTHNANKHNSILHQKSAELVGEVDLICNFHIPRFSKDFEKWYELLEIFFESKNPVIVQLVQYQKLGEEFREIYKNKLYPAFEKFDEMSQVIKQKITNFKFNTELNYPTKRNRDASIVKDLMKQIHRPTIDALLNDIFQNQMTSHSFFFWHGFDALFTSSLIQFYDKELQVIFSKFHDDWNNALDSSGDVFGPEGNGNLSLKTDHLWDKEDEKQFEKMVNNYKKFSESYKKLLKYLHENYIEIDLKITDEIAWHSYMEHQNTSQAVARNRKERDTDLDNVQPPPST